MPDRWLHRERNVFQMAKLHIGHVQKVGSRRYHGRYGEIDEIRRRATEPFAPEGCRIQAQARRQTVHGQRRSAVNGRHADVELSIRE